jgi:hypothetical protein
MQESIVDRIELEVDRVGSLARGNDGWRCGSSAEHCCRNGRSRDRGGHSLVLNEPSAGVAAVAVCGLGDFHLDQFSRSCPDGGLEISCRDVVGQVGTVANLDICSADGESEGARDERRVSLGLGLCEGAIIAVVLDEGEFFCLERSRPQFIDAGHILDFDCSSGIRQDISSAIIAIPDHGRLHLIVAVETIQRALESACLTAVGDVYPLFIGRCGCDLPVHPQLQNARGGDRHREHLHFRLDSAVGGDLIDLVGREGGRGLTVGHLHSDIDEASSSHVDLVGLKVVALPSFHGDAGLGSRDVILVELEHRLVGVAVDQRRSGGSLGAIVRIYVQGEVVVGCPLELVSPSRRSSEIPTPSLGIVAFIDVALSQVSSETSFLRGSQGT